jgi:protein Tex
MDNPIPVDLGRVAQDLQIRRVQVESVVQLLDEGNTVPFITRYRKERTGNLNEVVIREIQLRVQRLRELAERKETILKSIEAQGKLSPELATAIRAAENPKRLEDLYLPFKPKKRTKASDAREKGLEPLALRVWNRDETLVDLTAAAQEFVDAEKGLETPEKVLDGVGHILSEAISEMAAVRDAVRKVVWKTGKIVTSKGEIPEGQGLEYRDYFDYSEPLSQVPPHRVLAINRGDKEGPLKIRLEVVRPDLEAGFFQQLPLEGHPQAEFFHAAAIDALDRLILPSMEREVRRDLTEAAERHAVDVFARNLRSLLLQPPIPKQVVLAIDPGLRSGCKVAVLDAQGNLLDQTVIYPHAPQSRRSEAKLVLKDLVGKHQVGVVAIGNGTACRETEELIAEIIAEGIQFSQGQPFTDSDLAAAAAPEPEPDQAPSIDHTAHAAVAESSSPTLAIEPAPASDPGIESEPVLSEHPAAEAELAVPADDQVASLEPETTGNSHVPPHEPEHAEALSEESLPPITGGAPEPASTESEPAQQPDPPSSGPETHQPEPSHDAHAETSSAGTDGESSEPVGSSLVSHPVVEESTAPADVEASPSEPAPPQLAPAEAEGAEISTASGHEETVAPEMPASELLVPIEPSPTPSGEDTPPEGELPGPGGEAATPATVPAGEAKPAHEPRRGGGGRHDHGRSRGQRSKPAATPPPPPTPPAPHPADHLLAQLAYVIVNEAGASVYSTSQVGREELPEFDATLRSSISIGRRLQDPLAEMVKIEPQNIGVGLYQHDVNPKQLKETLESVISSCVNFVGVDLNTASVPLLRHVSGLNQLTARRIVDYRKDKGAFTDRGQLIEVEGIGPATFTQSAGFLKILEGANPLDWTWVHPESYEVATRLLEKFGHAPEVVRHKDQLPELHQQLAAADLGELAKDLGVGEFTLRDIIEALGRPERDPRDDLPKPIFKKGILKLEDLTAGMELKGTVLNVVDFGAFVDIGLKDSGLVHISQLANRYIKSPHDVVSVGDVVNVWVMSVDQERKRVSLTMVKPGTERQRGGPGGGQRRGQGPAEPREGQGGRRDRARAPRPSGSALTSPPVGAAPITALVEPPARRPDRDRGGPPGSHGRSGAPGEGGGHGQQGGGFPSGGGRPGPGPRPGPGRGGPRGGPSGPGQGPGPGRPGPGRQERPQPPRGPSRPSRPSPPPPPLSKEALTGSVPLRTFGQLKQLWEARETSEDEATGQPGLDQRSAPEAPVSSEAHPEPAPEQVSSPPHEEPGSGAAETP